MKHTVTKYRSKRVIYFGEPPKAIQQDPGYANAYLCRGIAYRRKREYDKAIADLGVTAEFNPNPVEASIARGEIFLDKKDYESALADFRKAAILDPGNAVALTHTAWVRATCPVDSVRDSAKAFSAASKACRWTKFEDPYALVALAAAYAESGDFTSAVEWQEKALKVPVMFGKEGLERENKRLNLYREHKPYHGE